MAADAGDFEDFVRGSGPSLLRTAYLLTGDRGHAEDLLQNVLERTARRWSRLDGSPEAYARRSLFNAANDGRRRRRVRAAEVLTAQLPACGIADGNATVDLRLALVAALQELPLRQRSVLVCRHVLDLDEAQTAAALGVSIGTVKASGSRGLAALRLRAPQLDLVPARTPQEKS